MDSNIRSHDEQQLLDEAIHGRLSRRAVLKRGIALGLSAPAIGAILAACGGGDDDDDGETDGEASPTSAAGQATSEPPASDGESTPTEASEEQDGEPSPTEGGETDAEPTEPSEATQEDGASEGGGQGLLRILWWQAPVVLNAHMSVAGKDIGATMTCMEPLAYHDSEGQLVPYLASEIPTVENGGLAEDFSSVTWKLREGVKWHDGEDFNAEDVVFTYEYLSDPETNATTLGFYDDVESVVADDDYTVTVTFSGPTADWFEPFVGGSGTILPEHLLRDAIGPDAMDHPFNLSPIGTGPFRVVEFRPGDVAVYERFEDYWDGDKPYFDRVEIKGGGDTASAARAVLQSGEADWAWNLQLESDLLESFSQAGQGVLVTWPGAGTEKLVINHSDPETEQDGQRSHRDVPHPHLSNLTVRQAIALALQRDVMAEQLYGDAGTATGYTLNSNPEFMPDGITWEYDIERANELLDEAGATRDDDGIRSMNGRRFEWVSSASLNSLRQKEQEIIKESFNELGINLEIAAIEASVYFDASNIDSFQRMYYEFGLERNSGGIYPLNWYRRYVSIEPETEIAQQENGWSGRNFGRYQNPEFNELYQQASAEANEEEYLPIFHEMQRLVVEDIADVGLVSTNNVAAASSDLTGYEPSQFATDVWDIKNWRRS